MASYRASRINRQDFAVIRAILHRFGKSSLRSLVIRSGMSTDRCSRLLKKMIHHGVVLKHPNKNSIGATYGLNEYRPYRMRVILMISRSTRICKVHITGYQGRTLKLFLDFKEQMNPVELGRFINEQCLGNPELEQIVIEVPGSIHGTKVEDCPIPEIDDEDFLPSMLHEIEPPYSLMTRVINRPIDHHEELFLLDPHGDVHEGYDILRTGTAQTE